MVYNDKKTVAEFGNGDITINIGSTQDTAYLFFTNMNNPEEVGTVKPCEKSMCEILDTCDMIFSFSNKESIDVVIKSLTIAKTLMED